LVAGAAPLFEYVMVYVSSPPGTAVVGHAVFDTWRIAQLTVIDTVVVVPVPPLVDVKLAVLVIVAPHATVDVGLVTWSLIVEPAGNVNVPVVLGDVPQLSTCGFVPLMPHEMPLGIELPAVSSVHVRPPALGRLSVSVTPVASPAPVFDNVTV
jgi:hypothetical protein